MNKNQDISLSKESTANSDELFEDLKYICNSSSIIIDALRKGCDVAQLPNGDVVVTEVKVVNTQYSWDQDKARMVRISQN